MSTLEKDMYERIKVTGPKKQNDQAITSWAYTGLSTVNPDL